MPLAPVIVYVHYRPRKMSGATRQGSMGLARMTVCGDALALEAASTGRVLSGGVSGSARFLFSFAVIGVASRGHIPPGPVAGRLRAPHKSARATCDGRGIDGARLGEQRERMNGGQPPLVSPPSPARPSRPGINGEANRNVMRRSSFGSTICGYKQQHHAGPLAKPLAATHSPARSLAPFAPPACRRVDQGSSGKPPIVGGAGYAPTITPGRRGTTAASPALSVPAMAERLYWTLRTWGRMSAAVPRAAVVNGSPPWTTPGFATLGGLVRALSRLASQRVDALLGPLLRPGEHEAAEEFLRTLGAASMAGMSFSTIHPVGGDAAAAFQRIAQRFELLEDDGSPRWESHLFASAVRLLDHGVAARSQ